MKYSSILTVVGLCILAASCASSLLGNQTEFFENFSAEEFFEDVLSSLSVEGRYAASGGATSSSGSGQRIHHADYWVDVQISSFPDGPTWLQSVREKLIARMKESGANAETRVEATDHFSVAYDDGRFCGWVDFWSFRREGNRYRMLLIINEF